MTHTDLIARLREARPRLYVGRGLLNEAADALTAAQERIEMAECAGFSAGYEAGQKDAQERIEALEGALRGFTEHEELQDREYLEYLSADLNDKLDRARDALDAPDNT